MEEPAPSPEGAPAPQPVTAPEVLAELAARWRGRAAIALDTEFVRERTFYPKLGLLQVADEDGPVLVDPLALADLEPLRRVLADPSIVKVVHSAGEDLEVLFHRFGETPRGLFDTQIAAALAGLGPALGYGALVRALFDVELPKGETRTDWLRRPLTEAQCRYAALDVAYLLPAWRHLSGRLRELGREAWLEEDLAVHADPARFRPDPDGAWRRVKGAGGLDRPGLAVLRVLAAWRDGEARRRDLPRNFVVPEAALLELARGRPKAPGELRKIRALRPADHRRYGSELLRLVASGLRTQVEPASREPRVDPDAFRELVRTLRAEVADEAARRDLPPEVLANRATIEAVARRVLAGETELPAELRGWRREVLGERLRGRLTGVATPTL